MFNHVTNKQLPSWVQDLHCNNWAQFFLKFILAHPAVTCAIPATSQVAHMKENMGALLGPVPTLVQKEKMAEYFSRL